RKRNPTVSSGSSNGTVAAPSDRTTRAVATQVRAMACTSYEIGARNPVQGHMLLRTWTGAELEHGVSWLRRVNAHAHDTYIPPDGSGGSSCGTISTRRSSGSVALSCRTACGRELSTAFGAEVVAGEDILK